MIQFHSRRPDVRPQLCSNNKDRDHGCDLGILDNGVWDSGSDWRSFKNPAKMCITSSRDENGAWAKQRGTN